VIIKSLTLAASSYDISINLILRLPSMFFDGPRTILTSIGPVC
jgi:hypothetical protein